MRTAELIRHWDRRFATSPDERLSWFEPSAELSLKLISDLAPARSSRIVDVGGGTSRLGAGLAAVGYLDLSIVDLSQVRLRGTVLCSLIAATPRVSFRRTFEAG